MILRVLIIGLGKIGMGYDLNIDPKQRISTLARACSEHADVALVGGVDLDPDKRHDFEENYGVQTYSKAYLGVQKEEPDIVIIAVPTKYHLSVMREIIEYPFIKAILCEKPLAFDLNEATEMVMIANQHCVQLYTNYMRRCDRGVIEVKEWLQYGRIKGVIKGVCWYSKGLIHSGSHFLNLLEFWLGSVVDYQVIAVGEREKVDPEPDVKVIFERGEVVFYAVHKTQFYHYGIELMAENGCIKYGLGTISWYGVEEDQHNSGYQLLEKLPQHFKTDASHLQWHVIDQLLNAIQGGDSTLCTGEEGLMTLRVLKQISDSL